MKRRSARRRCVDGGAATRPQESTAGKLTGASLPGLVIYSLIAVTTYDLLHSGCPYRKGAREVAAMAADGGAMANISCTVAQYLVFACGAWGRGLRTRDSRRSTA
jgi:hypothetical protein